MGFVVRLLVMLAIATGIGFGASYYALTDGRIIGAERAGPWSAWPDVGRANPAPYSRAYLARNGFLQLGEAEGIQFVAVTDSAGIPLERSCHYSLSGGTPGATFWTLVALTPEGENIAADSGAMALHSDRLARANDGSVNVSVSPRLAPGNWLETTGQGPFQLVLTLYDAAIFSGGATSIEGMPRITQERCG